MTDLLKGCVVVFDRDIRTDDAEQLLAAIRQLRGVAGVTTSMRTPDDWMNRERVRLDLQQRLYDALKTHD